MPHWKTMMDRDKLHACDLGGQKRVVTIEKVEQAEVQNATKKAKKPQVTFKGQPKPLVLNSTNAKTISRMYGPITEDWIGKRITIYPTTTEMGSETVECIRVEANIPTEPKRSAKSDDAQEPQS